MEKSRIDEYVQAIQSKGVDAPCPRCNNTRFDILGESTLPIQENPNVVQVGGPSIPVVIIACAQCGFITLHAQGVLGMMKGGNK